MKSSVHQDHDKYWFTFIACLLLQLYSVSASKISFHSVVKPHSSRKTTAGVMVWDTMYRAIYTVKKNLAFNKNSTGICSSLKNKVLARRSSTKINEVKYLLNKLQQTYPIIAATSRVAAWPGCSALAEKKFVDQCFLRQGTAYKHTAHLPN